jgi:hypothetical protein
MSAQHVPEGMSYDRIQSRLKDLEARIAGLEEALHFRNVTGRTAPEGVQEANGSENDFIQVDKLVLESRIGEFGFTWLGSLVLLFGIIFLMAFINKQGYPLAATLIGYACAGVVFTTTHLVRKSLEHLGFMLRISGYLLLYYVTFRLHFFSENPLVKDAALGTSLLTAVTAVELFFGIRGKSALLTSIGQCLLIITAIFADNLHVSFLLVTSTSVIAAFGYWKFEWKNGLIVNIWLVYLFHLLWLFGNPVAGHSFQASATQPYSLVYLFAAGAVYAALALLSNNPRFTLGTINLIIVSNAIGFSLAAFLSATILFPTHYVGMFGIISTFCIAYAVILEFIRKNPFIPSLFACFGFMALSVCVYGFAGLPNTYFWLALQSFMVVCIALWFGSRIIVVMNTILFTGLLLVYMASAQPSNLIGFTFAIVAFGSARIINWQKKRLTLQTDFVRNVYLFALFFSMLHACYFAFTARYAAISWAGTAVLYFILSLILRNIKYRWLSVATLMVAVLYIFLVDLAQLEVGYRVIAFLILAIVLFGVSLYYTKYLRKRKASHQESSAETGN